MATTELRTGDVVRVAQRTGSGVEHWIGVVDHVDPATRMATIVGSGRRRHVAVKGAMFVHQLTDGPDWDAFTAAHPWPETEPAPA